MKIRELAKEGAQAWLELVVVCGNGSRAEIRRRERRETSFVPFPSVEVVEWGCTNVNENKIWPNLSCRLTRESCLMEEVCKGGRSLKLMEVITHQK